MNGKFMAYAENYKLEPLTTTQYVCLVDRRFFSDVISR